MLGVRATCCLLTSSQIPASPGGWREGQSNRSTRRSMGSPNQRRHCKSLGGSSSHKEEALPPVSTCFCFSCGESGCSTYSPSHLSAASTCYSRACPQSHEEQDESFSSSRVPHMSIDTAPTLPHALNHCCFFNVTLFLGQGGIQQVSILSAIYQCPPQHLPQSLDVMGALGQKPAPLLCMRTDKVNTQAGVSGQI